MGAETTNGDGFGLGWYGAGEGPGALPQRRAGLGRREPARARGAHRVAAVHRARARDDGHRDPADQLPPVPPRPLAVRPQRRHRRLPRDAPRADARGRTRAVRGHPGLDGLRGALPPRADLRPRAGPGRRARARDRARRGDGRAGTASSTPCRRASASPTASACGRSATRPRAARARCSCRPTRTSMRRLHPENPRLQRLRDEDRVVVSEPLADLPGCGTRSPSRPS